MMGEGAVRMTQTTACYERPYDSLPKPTLLELLLERIERFFDDEVCYQTFVTCASHVGCTSHGLHQPRPPAARADPAGEANAPHTWPPR